MFLKKYMNFKLISIKKITDGLKTAIQRFPMAMLAAAVGTIIGIILIHIDDPSSFYPKILMALALGFPLFVSIVLAGEEQKWDFNKKIAVNITAVVFLIGYYFWLPNNIFEAQSMFIIRYIMWAIGFVLLITFVPFLKKNKEKTVSTFWHYNKILVYSVILTAIWAFAIQSGLSIAIASVNFLFNANIDSKRYMEMWVIIVGIFSTTFFLSRIPKDTQHPEEDSYPKELRLFSQFVLVPLTTLYFVILYAYVIRIFVLWEWPKGVLAYMILGFSLLGVFTYVVMHPLREKISWVSKTGKIFFIVLIPQVGMLFWALWFRITEYGITENRYFVFVFGWWLLAMAIYFLFSKKKDIRIIPITVFAIALLSSFGPWGAFSISEKSQINRLENLLVKNNILIKNKIKKTTEEVSFEDRKEIGATIRYLSEVHGLDGIQPWFDVDLVNYGEKENVYYSSYALTEKIVEDIMGIDYVSEWEGRSIEEGEYFNFYTTYEKWEKVADISGYDYMIKLNTTDVTREINGIKYGFKIEDADLTITENNNIIAQVNLNDFLANLDKKSSTQDEIVFEFKNENISFVLNFDSINGEKRDGKYKINYINAEMLFTLSK